MVWQFELRITGKSMYVNVSKSEWNQPLLPWSITCIAETVYIYIVGIAVEINGKLILTISKVSELIQVPSASSCPTLHSENHFGWTSDVCRVFLDQGFSQHTTGLCFFWVGFRLILTPPDSSPENVAGTFPKELKPLQSLLPEMWLPGFFGFTAISPVVFMGWFPTF